MKEFIKCFGNRVNSIVVNLYYDLGGYNYVNYSEKPRGYYISVQPMELKKHDNGLESCCFGIYTGYNKLLLECKRRSKSAEDKAKALYENAKKQLVNRVIEEQNLILIENETIAG